MLLAKNRKALHNHEILEKFIAGIVLKGYEVKAIKEGKVAFEGAFVKIVNNNAVVTGLHIGKYSKQWQDVQDTRVDRQLLLNQREIQKIRQETQQKGKTVIPLALLLKNNLIKLEIATVKGRKKHEKKTLAKEKQIKKDLEKSKGMIRI